jgi:uncharacterized protein DUF3617
MRYSTIATLAAALLPAPAHAAAANMKEGLWEITMKMEAPGMPAGMKPHVMQQCITKKDLDDPRKTMPGNDPKSDRCEVSNYKVQGNTATWNMACKGQDAMTGSGSVTYNGTSYSGTNKMTMKQGGQLQTMTMHYTGKHLGECKK